MTHISLELAKWLKERGCEVENGMCILLDCNELCRKEDLGDYRIGRDAMRTYSWYDILVTHAKEFWGEGEVGMNDAVWVDDTGQMRKCSPNYENYARIILTLLQQNKIQEAEDYVRQYSVFANPKP